jgi:restriction system protein
MQTLLDLLIVAAKFMVGLWPLMFLLLFIGINKRERGFGAVLRSSFKGLIFAWGLLAVLRMIFTFMKMETFHLIPEPADTSFFLATGLLLLPFEVALLLEEKRKKFTASTLEEIRALSPKDFEELVADTYRAQGNTVQVVGGTGDHGIDLVVETKKGSYLVQCKRYRGKIGEPIVRDFYGVLRASDAQGGAIITSGTITDAARLWAEGKPIHMYDGEQFLKIVLATRVRKNLPAAAKNIPTPQKTTAPAPAAPRVVMPAMQPAYAVSSISSEAFDSYVPAPQPAAVSVDETHSVVTSATIEPNDDKRPFMELNNAPTCPACGVPMVLHSEKGFLFFKKPTKLYICPNAPQCTQTHEFSEEE